MRTIHGISAVNRKRLESLHRQLKGPFSVEEAATVWKLDSTRARRLLAQLASSGWLSRVRRNAYTAVPLGATAPGEWREDPWIVAAKTFAPCYLGGWTACEHWGLTEQIFREIIVVTSRRVRHRVQDIQGTRVRIKVVSAARIFGLQTVRRGQSKVPLSDPTRTVLDLLDDPTMGGGMRHVAEVVRGYFEGSARDDARMVSDADRIGNRTIFKRLGYLIETLGLSAPDLSQTCRGRLSAGIGLLDPAAKPVGPILKRWGLRVNAKVEHVASSSAG
ncbi:MAG: hypothetical protein HYY93_15105 [Planctomycetes bacterium]|nr:hypothetical protein [Planctomycetota bacterium]